MVSKKRVSREEILERAEQHVGRLVANIAEGYGVHHRCALEIVQLAVLNVGWTMGSFDGTELVTRVSDRHDKRERDAKEEEKAIARAERKGGKRALTSGSRNGLKGKHCKCGAQATVISDGKPVCNMHDPFANPER